MTTATALDAALSRVATCIDPQDTSASAHTAQQLLDALVDLASTLVDADLSQLLRTPPPRTSRVATTAVRHLLTTHLETIVSTEQPAQPAPSTPPTGSQPTTRTDAPRPSPTEHAQTLRRSAAAKRHSASGFLNIAAAREHATALAALGGAQAQLAAAHTAHAALLLTQEAHRPFMLEFAEGAAPGTDDTTTAP